MRKSIWKRALSLVLSLAMLLTLVPAFNVLPEAEAATVVAAASDTGPQGNYITLPITIRDFAADGMLFEYNEVDSSDTITIGGAAAVGYPVYENPDDWAVNNYYSFRLYDYGEIAFDTTNSGLNWHCVICDGSGNVVDVLAKGEAKETTYNSVMQSGYFSIWVWEGDHENYAVLSKVTDENKSVYAIDFHYDSDAEAYKMYIGYRYNENAWGSTSGTTHTGINYFAAGQNPFDGYDALWADCLICDASGNVIQAIGAGSEKKTAFNAMTSGQFALFATGNDGVAQGIIRAIAGDNPTEYQATFVTDNYYGTDLLFLGNAGQSMTIHQNDTKGFGLMLTGGNDRYKDLPLTATADENGVIVDNNGPGTYISNGTYGSSTAPATTQIELNSGATQLGHGITIRTDLVEPNLVDGKPVYTEETVTYLAEYMNKIMAEVWQNEDGSYNSFFVMGTKMFTAEETYVGPDSDEAVLDLAQVLRNHVTGGLGTYAATMSKLAVNANALSLAVQCETWFDAAYYLLHYTWQDSSWETNTGSGTDGYGKYVPQYDSLHLVEKTNTDGSVYYIFNSAYDNAVYNPVKKWIYNNQTTDITVAQLGGEDFYTRGIALPEARFDPLGLSGTESTGTAQWLGYGANAGGNTYGDLTGASATQSWDEFYDTTNYHLSLEGHAEFVFHYASNLYFTFTGDDDVYLYINGVRVLDLGAAHSIVKAQINLNDVAELCGLKEGEPASFDFFYLERHGTAANFGIETNIQLAQSGMITSKEGYQNGVSTGYNGPVDPSKPVAYSFTIKNGGDATLEHLTFTDAQLDVSLSEYDLDWGNKIEGTEADGTLVDGGPIKNMYLYIRDENDEIVRFYSAATTPALTEDLLKSELETGLQKGESMTLYNFRYKITDAEWQAGSGTFTNTVNTTAIANGKLVTGTADWKVRKADLVTDPFHIYNWVNKKMRDTEWQSRNVGLTKTELVQPVLDAAEKNGNTDLISKVNSSADIVLCNSGGIENSALWSEEYTNIIQNVTLGEDDSITYNSKAPGMETVYYKIKNIGYPNRVYHFDVFTYGAADNVYVLDYGLKVKLNEDEFSFQANDKLTVAENIHNPTTTITGLNNNTSVYGDFMVEDTTKESGYKVMNGDTFATGDGDKSIEYWPRNIMNGTDSFRVEIQVREPGADTTKDMKYWGVDMYETVTTAPANVVYYEEDFPGLVYAKDIGYGWVHYETIDPDTNQPISGDYQSADQDSEYGSDPNYDKDKGAYLPTESEETTGETEGQNGSTDSNFINPGENSSTVQNLLLDTGNLSTLQKTALKAMERFLGVGGTDSNGSIYELDVKDTGEVMYFEFVGTGFEIISRTADDQYAILAVQVQANNDNDDTYETVVAHKPVITESRGGDQYQVPIISITGLERKQYRVVITAAGEYTAADGTVTKRMLYIDGIRIYNPLAPNEQLEYYNPNEAQAEFLEVKQLIKDGQAAYFGLESEDENGKFFLVSGISYAENFSGEGVLTEIDNINEYLQNGPNNELYLEANERLGNMAAFYLTPKDGFTEEQRTIQIGAHRKITSESNVRKSVVMTYGSTRDDIVNAEDGDANYKSISTGTEMYYTIDPALLQTDEEGRYLVMIGTNRSDEEETLVLTNLKVSGYTVEPMEATLKESYREGTQEENSFLVELIDMYLAVITQNRDVARLITEGNAALIGYDETLKEPYLYSRRSYITDLNGEGKREVIENQDEYLADQGRVGDFGELKLTVSDNFTDMVAFYVKPNTNVPESARYIQLGAQATDIGGTAVVAYGNSSAVFDLEIYTEPVGYEETLFKITVDETWDDGNGRYLVIITAGADKNGQRQPFALTSLELCGYTIEPANETEKTLEMEIRDAVSAEGDLDLAIITEALNVWATLFAAPETTAEEEETVTPASDEEDEALLPEEEEEAVTEETEAEEAEETEPEETEAVETEPEEAVDEIAE